MISSPFPFDGFTVSGKTVDPDQLVLAETSGFGFTLYSLALKEYNFQKVIGTVFLHEYSCSATPTMNNYI